MCTVITCLAKKQLEMFGLNIAFPAIVTDCGANMRKTFHNTLQWDWLFCGYHLIHNVVTAGFTTLRNNAHNPAQIEAKKCQKALDRWEMWIIVTQCIVFFKIRERYWESGIKYLHWLYRARSFVSHAKRSSNAPKSCGHYKSNRCSRTSLKAATQSQTPRKTRKKRMRAIHRVDMPMRNV